MGVHGGEELQGAWVHGVVGMSDMWCGWDVGRKVSEHETRSVRVSEAGKLQWN